MSKHLGIFALTGKRLKEDDDSAIKEHNLFYNHLSGFDNFSILASNNIDFKVTLMEFLLTETTLKGIRTCICSLLNFLMIEECNFGK